MTTYQSEAIPNYFVCTLGEATKLKHDKSTKYATVNHLIDHQRDLNPNLPAVAFPIPGPHGSEWKHHIYTFGDLCTGSVALAELFRDGIPQCSSSTVALLCPSSVNFLFAWLALMRAGYSVLIIAPQCQPSAVAHLCSSCNVSALFYDAACADVAQSASMAAKNHLDCQVIPWQKQGLSLDDAIRGPMKLSSKAQESQCGEDIAFLFHTSGTSTGLPKAIPQSHHAAVGVLPSLDGRNTATFTTTPLYHGGIADCLRSWTSSALIWLFPGADVPMTSNNILSSMECAKSATKQGIEPVSYFASVPYILQMLAEDSIGMKMLKNMEIVSVGGAALPQSIGDKLVRHGVNLVSRFGSSECGFLLSSHRLYHEDKEWQYLRMPVNSKHLRFEQDDSGAGLFQLTVLSTWPHVSKTNRPDGSFATGDLFEPHPSVLNAWKYHSRNDSQITLSTGKKFDPAPLEDSIASSSQLIRDVLVFGNGRQVPGALLFPTSLSNKDIASASFEHAVWDIIHGINLQGQDHTRISRSMVLFMPPSAETLPKSSKGTILRTIAYDQFKKPIEEAYEGVPINRLDLLTKSSSASEVLAKVRQIVQIATGDKSAPSDDSDFYHHGVDSAMCAQIRGRLQRALGGEIKLPWSVVYDCGSVKVLTQHVVKVVQGKSLIEEDDGTQDMLDLARQYSKFQPLYWIHGHEQAEAETGVILLTGATGALGAHILDLIRNRKGVSRVICLVRAENDDAARSRVCASLVKRGKRCLDQRDKSVVCYAASLGSLNFGLSKDDFSTLQHTATHIIHSAWAVNFSIPLKSFVDDHIVGLTNLIDLSISSHQKAKLFFCSSTASVLCSPQHSIPESISIDPADADTLGYSRSKWVAECICHSASQIEGMRGRINVMRIGQLTGDREHGIWNMSEAWPLMLSTADILGCLPDLSDERLNWMPVDVAAQAVVDIALENTNSSPEHGEESCPVLHLVSNATSQTPTWSNLLRWIQEAHPRTNSGREPFEVVAPAIWLRKLQNLDSHPAQALLGLWERAYGTQTDEAEGQLRRTRYFESLRANGASESMRSLKPLDEELVGKIWRWLETEARGLGNSGQQSPRERK